MAVGCHYDLVAFVTAKEFRGRKGAIGDYLSLDWFRARHEEASVCVIEFNHPRTRIQIGESSLLISQSEFERVDPALASLVLYMPVSFEPEDVALRPLAGLDADGLFAHRQWRAIGEFLEVVLAKHPNCINNPRRARLANNKLVQADVLTQMRAPALSMLVSDAIPDRPQGEMLVCKNLSEGARKSPTEFSNTRLVGPLGERMGYPLIFQRYIAADHEMRFYVFDDEIVPIRIRRRVEDGLVDVRAMALSEADVDISFDYSAFHPNILAASRALGLSYAVIDAIPEKGELFILEINANGVWWMLPAPLQERICTEFHKFLYRRLSGSQRRDLRS